MSNDQFSILILSIFMMLSGIVAAIAGFVYVKTSEEHGGFVCLLFAIITLSIGSDVLAAVEALTN